MESGAVEYIMIVATTTIVVVGVVSWLAGRIGVATPLLLTVIGVGLGFLPGASEIVIDPEVILSVIIPPLLYAAALHVPFVDFRRNLQVITYLAVVLVVVSAFAVAALVDYLWPAVGFATALALGAVVAPPDAVAATSIGKRLGLPPRIVTILEGEGLVNDATALVLLSTAVGVATSGEEISAGGVIGALIASIIGALVVGWFIGRLAVAVRARFDDIVLDAGISIIVPFVAFLIAEEISASGIVAVVIAGIVVGNTGRSQVGARKRQIEQITWASFAMIVENAVFLYMGLRLRPTLDAVNAAEQVTLAVVGIGLLITLFLVVLRFAAMPPLLLIMRGRVRRLERRRSNGSRMIKAAEEYLRQSEDDRLASRVERFRFRMERHDNDVTAEHDQRLGWRDGVVLGWAGMRGVVTIAAVQTLPVEHPWYPALVLVAFIVAILTLVVQGLTLPALVRVLRLQSDESQHEGIEYRALIDHVGAKSRSALEKAIAESPEPIPPEVLAEIETSAAARKYRTRRAIAANDVENHDAVKQFVRLRRVELRAARDALNRERAIGAYSSEVLGRVQYLLDVDELQLDALDVVED